MNFSDYDNAVKIKLLKVFPNVVNSSQDKALQISENSKAQVKLPLISFWRLTNTYDVNYYSSFKVNRGSVHRRLNDDNFLLYKQIPFEITYQIDIWSDRLYEADELFSELLLYFVEEPYLNIKEFNTKDDEGIDVSFRVTDTDLEIDLSDFDDRGKLYQQIITITIDNAYLSYPTNKKRVDTIPIRTLSWDSDISDDTNREDIDNV